MQLSNIAVFCHKEEIEAVVTSPMPRAALAAEKLAHELKLPLYKDKNLAERDFGDWNHNTWPQNALKLKNFTVEDRYTFKPPNGESWQELEVRLRTALKGIAALKKNSVAVMTHSGCIKALWPALGVKSKEEALKKIPALGECFIEEYDPAKVG